MVDAGGVGDDQRRPVKALGLPHGAQRLVKVRTQRHLRHVYAAVGHHHIGQVLLGALLAVGSKLRHRAGGGRLAHLPAGVGVHLGIKDQHVDVGAGGKHMVQSAKADIVGPAVAAQDPVGFFAEELLVMQQLLGAGIQALGKHLDEGIGGGQVGLAVLQRGQIALQRLLFVRRLDLAHQRRGLADQALSHGILRQVHAVAVLGVILKQRVGPGRALAFFVFGIGDAGRRTAPDGGASGGVGDIHPRAEQLGQQLGVGGLAAAGAGAGELQQRLAELAALYGIDAELLHHRRLGGQLPSVVEVGLAGLFSLQTGHGQRLLALFAGADAHAQGTAGAVHHAGGHGKAVSGQAGHGQVGHTGGGGLRLGLGHHNGADDGVRAHQRAEVALDAVFRQPCGYLAGDAPLFVVGGAQRQVAVLPAQENGNRQVVALLQVRGDLDAVDVFHQLGVAAGGIEMDKIAALAGPVRRDGDLADVGKAALDGGVVHRHDIVALGAVGAGGGVLHQLQRLLGGDDAGQAEERGLQHGVHPAAQAQLLADGVGVDGIQVDLVLGQEGLSIAGQAALQLLHAPAAVQQKDAAGLDVMDHIVLADIGGVMAGHKVRLAHQVGGFDGLAAKAQMADRQAAALFGIVGKIPLRIQVGVVSDDLDGVFVGAHGTVGAQAPEFAADGGFRGGIGKFGLQQRKVGHVVGDAHGKAGLFAGFGVAVHRKDLAGGHILAAQAVAAGVDRHRFKPAAAQRRHHIQVQRLADGARLLGAVQHGDGFDRIRQGAQQMLPGEGAVQPHLDEARLLAVGPLVVDDLLDGLAHRAHRHDDLLGVWIAVVVEQVVVAADHRVDLVHIFLYHAGQGIVELVGDLPLLEVDVGVLGAAAQHGAVGGKPAVAEGIHRGAIQQLLQLGVVPHLYLLDLVGGTEAVEEMQKGDAPLDGRQVGDGRQVHYLLHAAGAQHGKAGLPAGIDIAVVAEDGKGVGSQRAGRTVDDAGQQLAGHFIHIGDHQQQPLRGGKGGGQRPRRQRTVHRTGHAALALHLDDAHRFAEQVQPAGRRPGVGQLRHHAGRGDGVDGRHIGIGVGHMGRRGVAVHRLHVSIHLGTSRRHRKNCHYYNASVIILTNFPLFFVGLIQFYHRYRSGVYKIDF